jgi:hypothetical protein
MTEDLLDRWYYEHFSRCHEAPLWCNRCSACGHRQPVNGVAPRQTRELPPWHWPGELVNRRRARNFGRRG